MAAVVCRTCYLHPGALSMTENIYFSTFCCLRHDRGWSMLILGVLLCRRMVVSATTSWIKFSQLLHTFLTWRALEITRKLSKSTVMHCHTTILWLYVLGRLFLHENYILSNKEQVEKKSYPCNRPWRPIGLWDVKDPTLSRQSAHS
jgi:hypothetical protein